MRRLALAAASALAGMASTHASATFARNPEQISYGCDDVVVVARFQNDHHYSEPIATDGILGYGWLRARVNVIEFLAGPRPRPPIVVKYIAHTWFTEGRDVVLVLYRELGTDFYAMRSMRFLERADDVELASRCVKEFPESDS